MLPIRGEVTEVNADQAQAENIVKKWLALPDGSAEKRYIREHAADIGQSLAVELKSQADYYLRADIQQALRIADLLTRLGRAQANAHIEAIGILAQANVAFIGDGAYARSVELYDQAAAIYEREDRLLEMAQAHIGKIGALMHLGRLEEALQAGFWAAQVFEEHQDWLLLAKVSGNLAVIFFRQGDDQKALSYFDRAQENYARVDQVQGPGWLMAEFNRAIVMRNLGRFEESIRASKRAWESLDRLGHTIEAARAQQNLAITYFVLGRYNQALQLLDRVRNVFSDDQRHRDAILVDLFISDCLLHLRRFEEVLEKCRQVRSLFAELGTQFEITLAVVNEAIAYAGLGRYTDALDSLLEARRHFEDTGNSLWVAAVDLERAGLLLEEGRDQAGLELAETCLEVLETQPVKAAQCHLIIARARLALQDLDEADAAIQQALGIGEAKDLPSISHQGLHLAGRLARMQGDQERAYSALDQAIVQLERLRGRLMSEYQAGFVEDKQAAYEEMVQLCLNLERPEAGLAYAERAKSRALLNLIAYRLEVGIQPRDPDDERLVAQLNKLRQERDRLIRRWESGNPDEFQERGWSPQDVGREKSQQEVLSIEKQITGLWHQLLVRNADYARDAALWNVRAEPIQPYLDQESLLVEYYFAGNQLCVFLVSKDDITATTLACDLSELQRIARLLRMNLNAVRRLPAGQLSALIANAQGLLKRLHQHLMEPLMETICKYGHLIIVPHGLLHYLPFHAFFDGRHYLVETFEFSYLPSASYLRYACEATTSQRGCIAFGHSHGGRLPYTVREASRVAEMLDGQIFLEESATRAALAERAGGNRMVHIATHGEFRADNPLFSGLALDDGWMTALDIFDLRIPASLVTLSACQSGSSVLGGGDELLGLIRAFLSAGAASLLLSYWAIEDRSTSRLMEKFYEQLAGGSTKAAALRATQIDLIRSPGNQEGDRLWSHPYFWAAFFLIGDSGSL